MEEAQWIEFTGVGKEKILIKKSSITGVDENSGLNGVVIISTTTKEYAVEGDYNGLKDLLVGIIDFNCYTFPIQKQSETVYRTIIQ